MAATHKHVYGWIPDIADPRDHVYSVRRGAKLPQFVDRIGLDNPIEDQGYLGSCTGHAVSSAMEIVTTVPALSRLMAYYNARKIDNTVRRDAGATMRGTIKGMQKFGTCVEPLWPYDVTKFAKKPSKAAFADAAIQRQKLFEYKRLTTLNDIKGSLAEQLPVIFGFAVPEYFESDDVANSGWLDFPSTKDRIVGGHAVMACGYDERGVEPFVWVRNSWGPQWGIDGYYKMPYKWFTDSTRLADDFWVLVPQK